MTPRWNIVQPLAATNYVINPSFEQWTGSVPTGWTKNNDTLAKQTIALWRGAYSLQCSQAGAGYAGVYQDIPLTNTQSYRCSMYIYLNAGQVIVNAYDYGGTSNPVIVTTSTAGWNRLVLTKVAANGGLRLLITANNVATTFYVDAVQVEDGTAETTYIDGDQPGCYWNGMAHLSTSTRDGQSREGGLPINLNTYFYKVLASFGSGTPPMRNVSLPFGLVGGEIYQRTIKQARTLTLIGDVVGASMTTFHNKRRALFDLLKYDAVTPTQPVKLQYDIDGINKLEIKAVYDGGLEMGQISAMIERIPLRFIAHDPLFYSEQESAQVLGYSQTVTNANYILQRKAGVWSAMEAGANGNVLAIAYNPIDGSMYVGGYFTAIGSATHQGIAKWNGSAFSDLGTGLSAGVHYVSCIAIAPNGDVYIGGVFDTANGVTCNNVAYWNGTTFVAMGGTPGTDGAVSTLCFDSSGNLYAGGSFTKAGGTTVNGIAKWNGTAWSAIGTGVAGGSAIVNTIVLGKDNNIYLGGSFTSCNSVSCAYIARVSGSTFAPLSSGFNSFCQSLAIAPDGKLYAGGDFTTAGGIAATYISVWNGTNWAPLGSGVNNQVLTMRFTSVGTLLAGGAFTVAGGITLPNKMAVWTGSTWLPMDVALPGTPSTGVITTDKFDNVYLGYNNNGSATSATVTASVNASTKTYPKFVITGPGTLYQIINYTTGRAIYFNGVVFQAGDRAVLDLTPGNITFTGRWWGNILRTIAQGSNLDWYLQPGSNNVSAYLVGGSAASSVQMLWRNAWWSADGVA